MWCPEDLTGAFGHFSSCLEMFLDSAAKKSCYCLNLALLVWNEKILSLLQCNVSCNETIKSLWKGSEGFQESLVNLVKLRRCGELQPRGDGSTSWAAGAGPARLCRTVQRDM